MREDIGDGDGDGYDSSDSSSYSSSSSDDIAPAANTDFAPATNTDFFRGLAGDDDFTHGTRVYGAEPEQEDIDASSDESVARTPEEIEEEEAGEEEIGDDESVARTPEEIEEEEADEEEEEIGDDDSVPRMLEEIEEEEADEEEIARGEAYEVEWLWKFMFEEEDKAVEVHWETDIRSLWSRATVNLADDADDMCFKRVKELAEYMEGDLKVMCTGNENKLRELVKARHPTFDNALEYLGDPLDVTHLVAVSPARVGFSREHIVECRWHSWHWQAYIACTHKLRKVFMQRDAIFFQAKVNGHDITWSIQRLVPQKLPNDVRHKVWCGFMRFFESIMIFVNWKLYRDIGLDYFRLPREDLHPLLEYVLGELASVQGNNDEDEETMVCKSLFQDHKFFLGSGVTRDPFLFVITSFGGVVSYEGEATPFGEEDNGITHQVVCLAPSGHRYPGRAYVQPQWILDCINRRSILPTEEYQVERVCPPHFSPFV